MKPIPDEKINLWMKAAIIVLAVFASIYMLADHVLPILSTFVSFIGPILLPFLLAFVIAVLLDPLIGICQRRLKMKRGLATLFILFLLVVVLAVVAGALVSRIVVEVSGLIHTLSTYNFDFNQISAIVDSFYSKFLVNFADVDTIKQGLQSFLSSFSDLSVRFLNGFVGVLRSTPTTFVMLLVTVFATYFFCKDKEMVLNIILKCVPKKSRGRARETYQHTVRAFSGYFRAQIIVMTVTAIWCMIGFAVLGLDYVFTMGILVGLFDILPVLGPGTLVIPWAIWSFITGDVKVGIGLAVIYAVITVSRQILEPKMVSEKIGLHPLATIASIFIGMKLFGVIGLIGGPIFVVVLMGFLKASKETRENPI